jgi:hypothetical protein
MPGCPEYNATDTACDGACTSPTVDQYIGTNNGTFFNEGGARYGTCNPAHLNNPCEVIKQLLLRQTNPDASEGLSDLVSVAIDGVPTNVLRGTFFEIKVPMIPASLVTVGGTTFCSADFNNGSPGERITGYATIDIYGVKCGNPNRAVVDDTYLAANSTDLTTLGCQPPSGDFVLGRMRCEEESGPGGGGNPGDSSTHARLVQ